MRTPRGEDDRPGGPWARMIAEWNLPRLSPGGGTRAGASARPSFFFSLNRFPGQIRRPACWPPGLPLAGGALTLASAASVFIARPHLALAGRRPGAVISTALRLWGRRFRQPRRCATGLGRCLAR